MGRLAGVALAVVGLALGAAWAGRRGARVAARAWQLALALGLVELGVTSAFALGWVPGGAVPDQREGSGPIVHEPFLRQPVPEAATPRATGGFARTPGRGRVLFVGDSFTHGQALDPARRFSGRVAAALDVEEVNQGLPGASFADEAALYLDVGAVFRPDVVVWIVVLNDLGLQRPEGWGPDWDDLIVDRTFEAPGPSLAWSLARRAVVGRARTAATEAAYRAVFSDPAQLAEVERTWREVVAELDRRGGQLLVAVFPMMHRLDAYPFAEAHARILDRARAAGAEALDLAPAFAGRDARALWLSGDDHHPNAQAHALAADALVDALRARPWPDAAAGGCLPEGAVQAHPERDAARRAACEDPTSPDRWLTWAAFWASHGADGPLSPMTPERLVEVGAAIAWVVAAEGDRPAVAARAAALTGRGADRSSAP